MKKLIQILTAIFIFLLISSGESIRAKEDSVKFEMNVSGANNGKKSLSFTLEPASGESFLGQNRIAIATRIKPITRIILDIPRAMDKNSIISSDKGKTSIFRSTGSSGLPLNGQLVIKDISGEIIDVVKFIALGKQNAYDSLETKALVKKFDERAPSPLSNNLALLNLKFSTGRFQSFIINFYNYQDKPVYIKGYMQYLWIKLTGDTFSSMRIKHGEFSKWVIIEPSEFVLQPGKSKKVNVICSVPDDKEDNYYARVIMELSPSEGKEINLSPKKNELKGNEPLELTVKLRKPGMTELVSTGRKINKNLRVEEVMLEGGIELFYPEGIKRIQAFYEKKLTTGEYTAEVSFKHGSKISISQSNKFSVK